MPAITSSDGSSATASLDMQAMVDAVPVTPWSIRPRRDALVPGVAILVMTWVVVALLATQAHDFLQAEVRDHAEHTVRTAARSCAPVMEGELAGVRKAVEVVLPQAESTYRLWVRPGADHPEMSGLKTLVAGGPAAQAPPTAEEEARGLEVLVGRTVPTQLVAGPQGYEVLVVQPVVLRDAVVGVLSVRLPATGLAVSLERLRTTTLLAAAVTAALALSISLLVYRTRRNERALAEQRHLAMQSLQRARDRALAADQAKTSFLAMMSHELRTPLNGILGMSELLMMGPLEPDEREMCGTIEGCGRHLLALVNDLLDFSAIETGRIDVRPVPCDPCDPLVALLDSIAPLCDQKGLEVVLSAEPSLPARVLGDPDRIRQMLAPLVSNAVKFTEQGRIELHVAMADGMVEYRVRDTGPGLPQHLQERLFRPFQQGEDYLRRQHGGTGLGLAITGRLALRLKAHITTEVNGGTCFRVRVPLEAVAPPRPWPSPGSTGTARLGAMDAALRSVIALDLACLGYQVVEHDPVDLLVLDAKVLAKEGVNPIRFVGHAGQVVILVGLADMVREGHRFADFGLTPLRKPFGRPQLAQALTRTNAGMTVMVRSLLRPG